MVSLEETCVSLRVFSEDPTAGDRELTAGSRFVCVALDENGEPAPVPDLDASADRARELVDAAAGSDVEPGACGEPRLLTSEDGKQDEQRQHEHTRGEHPLAVSAFGHTSGFGRDGHSSCSERAEGIPAAGPARANGLSSNVYGSGMDERNPDTPVMIAGLVLSVIAAVELYASWKRARDPE